MKTALKSVDGTTGVLDDHANFIISELEKRLNGQVVDALSEASDTSDTGFDDIFDVTLNSSRMDRRKSRRKSMVSGAAVQLLECVNKRRMSSVDVLNLLRVYHEQEGPQLRGDEEITCDVDLDSLLVGDLVSQIKTMDAEVEDMHDTYPKKAAMNHQQDLQEAITCLKKQYQVLMTSTASSNEIDTEVSEELKAIAVKADSIEKLMNEVQSLHSRIKEQIEEIDILEEINH